MANIKIVGVYNGDRSSIRGTLLHKAAFRLNQEHEGLSLLS